MKQKLSALVNEFKIGNETFNSECNILFEMKNVTLKAYDFVLVFIDH